MKVLNFLAHSPLEFFYGDEDAGVYEPVVTPPRRRAVPVLNIPPFGAGLPGAIQRAIAAPAAVMGSELRGLAGRIDEEIQYPLERGSAPRFSILYDLRADEAPVNPGEYWQYLNLGE